MTHDEGPRFGGGMVVGWETPAMVIRYLNREAVAHRIGVKPDTLSRYKLPPPDAMIGTVRGWLPETIDEWNAARPGRGRRA
jgi:hypothetical protein